MPELATITNNTASAGVQIAGEFTLQVEADSDWGTNPLAAAIDIEISEADTDAEYQKTGLQLRRSSQNAQRFPGSATRYVRAKGNNIASGSIVINYIQ